MQWPLAWGRSNLLERCSAGPGLENSGTVTGELLWLRRGWAVGAGLVCLLGCVDVPEITVAEGDATDPSDARGVDVDDPDARSPDPTGDSAAGAADAARDSGVQPMDSGPNCDISLVTPADRGDFALDGSTFEWDQPCPSRAVVYVCPRAAPCPMDWNCLADRITNTARYAGGVGEGNRGQFTCRNGGMLSARVYFWTVDSPWLLPRFRSFTAR